jgi:hypothetical protein
MRAHGTNPLITPWWIPLVIPLLPEEPSPVPESLLLTWNPSFACGAIPVHSGPRLLVNWPLPPFSFPPHSHFPPRWFPNPIMCPPMTTSRPRLHIVWYMKSLWRNTTSKTLYISATGLKINKVYVILNKIYFLILCEYAERASNATVWKSCTRTFERRGKNWSGTYGT